MGSQQNTRQFRRAAFKKLSLGKPSPPVICSSLLVYPRPFNFITCTDYEAALRCIYIQEYYRLGDELWPGGTQERRPRSVIIQDDRILLGSRPTWRGPDIEKDIELFESRRITDPEPFNKCTSYLVRMYGLGIKELQFLVRTPDLREREEQLETLELYHILKFVLGAPNVADLTEQLEFGFYALKKSRSVWTEAPGRGYDPGIHPPRRSDRQASRQLRAKMDRQREFQIAKVMADRLWDQFLVEGRRITRIVLRKQRLASGRRREGDWRKLSSIKQYILLGAEDAYYKQDPLFPQLASLCKLHPVFVMTYLLLFSTSPSRYTPVTLYL